MIAFSNTGTGFKGAISYVLKEHEKYLPFHKKPIVMEQNNVWGTSSEIAKQMRFIADSNSRSSRPVLHIAFSFHKDEKLSLEKSLQAMHLALKEINFHKEKNQYLLVKHNDTDVEHYHWVINKVDLEARNLDTSYIKNRLQVACDKVEKQLNLRYTQGRTIIYDPKVEKGYRFTKKETPKKKVFQEKTTNISDTKQFIYDQLQKVLLGLKNIESLEKELLKRGIECKATFNKNGLSGVSFRYNNQAYKGSQIGIKAKDILNTVRQNQITSLQYQVKTLHEFYRNINKVLSDIVSDYESGNSTSDFDKYFKKYEIVLEPERLFYKGFRISNKSIKQLKKTADTLVSGAIKDFEYQKHYYNTLMQKQPKEVPLFFGREKILTQNKRLLKEQQNAVEPQLKIKISRSQLPDFSSAFRKTIKEHKEKLAELTGTEDKGLKTVAVKKKNGIKL